MAIIWHEDNKERVKDEVGTVIPRGTRQQAAREDAPGAGEGLITNRYKTCLFFFKLLIIQV